jgi:hypothetical protein
MSSVCGLQLLQPHQSLVHYDGLVLQRCALGKAFVPGTKSPPRVRIHTIHCVARNLNTQQILSPAVSYRVRKRDALTVDILRRSCTGYDSVARRYRRTRCFVPCMKAQRIDVAILVGSEITVRAFRTGYESPAPEHIVIQLTSVRTTQRVRAEPRPGFSYPVRNL